MAPIQRENCQWTLDVSVIHTSGWKHEIRAQVLGRYGDWVQVGSWLWTGIGFPDELLPDVQARIAAVLTEHLVTRYGIRSELPMKWAGEPGAQ